MDRKKEQKIISSVEIAEITARKVRGMPFKKGYDQRRNLKGYPVGVPNFSTRIRIFIEKMAEQEGVTAEEKEEQLLAVGFVQALEGNFNFWSNIFDRLYGKPTQALEHKEEMDINGAEELAEKLQSILSQGKYSD